MANPIPGPRKRHTRQHVIADLSVHHVERFILEEGHTAQRVEKDYGCDLLLFTFDEQGYAAPCRVFRAGLAMNWRDFLLLATRLPDGVKHGTLRSGCHELCRMVKCKPQ